MPNAEIPLVVAASGAESAAPSGAVPIALYGIPDGGGGSTAWSDITGVPATLTAAAAAATPSVRAIGTTATTAAAGNHTHAASVVTVASTGGVTGANVQAALEAIVARIVALETT